MIDGKDQGDHGIGAVHIGQGVAVDAGGEQNGVAGQRSLPEEFLAR